LRSVGFPRPRRLRDPRERRRPPLSPPSRRHPPRDPLAPRRRPAPSRRAGLLPRSRDRPRLPRAAAARRPQPPAALWILRPRPLASLARPTDGRSALPQQIAPKGPAGSAGGSDTLLQYGLDGLKLGRGTFNLSVRRVGKGFDFAPVASQFADGSRKALFDRLQK